MITKKQIDICVSTVKIQWDFIQKIKLLLFSCIQSSENDKIKNCIEFELKWISPVGCIIFRQDIFWWHNNHHKLPTL